MCCIETVQFFFCNGLNEAVFSCEVSKLLTYFTVRTGFPIKDKVKVTL